MVINLIMSAFAIIGGVAYLPLASSEWKWPFALFEFILLSAILVIIWIGRRWRWHDRWFDTRRVAEYLRHAPIMLLLGVTRPAAEWPRGAQADWPETYVRAVLREIGLPRIALTPAYLRAALVQWLDWHVVGQRDYHRDKAKRLNRVHRNLERFSEMLFMLAVASVAVYLLAVLAGYTGLAPRDLMHDWSKPFTFLGVLFPTLGGALAGIHYFGDFERFAAISESTANRLSAIDQRIRLLLTAPDSELNYARVADIAHEVDEVVISEISHWQDVFAGKHISVPV
jgi:MFS family permease